MRSIARFIFVIVPTAALAGAVVIGVSRSGQDAATVSDGDLQRDLKLAASTIELAPTGQSVATVSTIEAPVAATPERSVRPKRSSSGSRAIRSRRPVVKAAPEAQVAESTEESEATQVSELAGGAAEATVEAPADAGVALPRPTAIPVSYPSPGAGNAPDGGWGGIGTVIRGGGIDGDHCQIHSGRSRRPPVYRQPRGISLGDRVSGAVSSAPSSRPTSPGGRVDRATGRSSGSSSQPASRGSIAGRVRAARGG